MSKKEMIEEEIQDEIRIENGMTIDAVIKQLKKFKEECKESGYEKVFVDMFDVDDVALYFSGIRKKTEWDISEEEKYAKEVLDRKRKQLQEAEERAQQLRKELGE